MTNSDLSCQAKFVIAEVFNLLSEEYLSHEIDRPIQEAASSFELEEDTEVTNQTFIRIVGDFVRHIYKHGLRIPKAVTPEMARAEAVFILEQAYQGRQAKGYYAAFLDVLAPNFDGLEFVLSQVAEIIIARERVQHLKWICTSSLRLSSWALRFEIAKTLQNLWRSFLPREILSCPPAQLANQVEDMVLILIDSDKAITKILKRDQGTNWH